MNKKIWIAVICVVTILSLILCLTSCNKQIIDLTYSYDRAIIELPNGEVVEGRVDSWKDYEGDQLQIKIDGYTYLVHSSDVVLISD